MRRSVLILLCLILLAFVSSPLTAQLTDTERPLPRVTEALNDANLAVLANPVHPSVKSAVDVGQVAGGLQMDRLTLVLKRSDAQEQALAKLLEEQQDPSSPNYHRWLTPTEFGERFGPAESDIQHVTGWLQSQGFAVDDVANGRVFIEFSGNAAQVARAFHTSIHQYQLAGETHIANATTVSVPAALAPVITSIHSLNDFRKRPMHYDQPAKVAQINAEAGKPSLTFSDGSHALAPSDYAVIYNIQPMYNQNINGAGRTIAVVGRSNVSTTLLNNFRALFLGGTGTVGSYTTIVNGTDPGRLGGGEEAEAYLDNEWASAVAPGAAIKFVVSKSTSTSDGVDLSEQYIIDTPTLGNHVDVMTESFGACEANNLTAGTLVSSLAQQAAAEGITYTVSSGDSGAALCADPATASATGANANPSVNILASSPYTVAVGGTEFNEGNCTMGLNGSGHEVLTCDSEAVYWNDTNSNTTGTLYQSARGHIPEVVWNEACPTNTTGSIAGCGAANANLFAAGGGASVLFNKPSWQKLAVLGIPTDDHRYVPDISLTAAGHDPYLVCLNDTITTTHPRVDCDPDPSTGLIYLGAIAGTSASAPAFAGVVAMLDQKLGGSQGDIHTGLYKLAAHEAYSACDGSNLSGARASTCVFSDVTVGNNAVPGMTNYGSTSVLYQAGVGFDEASGLGSVDVTNLLTNYSPLMGTTPTTTTLVVTPTTSKIGQSVTMVATVTGTGGTPTGSVAFVGTGNVTLATVSLSAGVATFQSTTIQPGIYQVIAQYAGDSTFDSSKSTAVFVVVNPLLQSMLTLSATPTNVTLGQPVTFTAVVEGSGAGSPTPTGSAVIVVDNVASSPSQLNSNQTATFTVSNLSVGSHNIGAEYLGDSNYSISSANPVTVTVANVAGATFTLSASSPTINLASEGSSGSSTVTVASTLGFAGTVNLACAIAAQAGKLAPTCTVAPGSVTLGAATNATVTFGSIAPTARPVTLGRNSARWPSADRVAFAGVFMFGLVRRRRRIWGVILALLMMVAVIGGVGCGGGSTSTSAVHTPGTTAGTYTATVTGTSGAITSSTQITVVVP
jgi:hypothetical protein